jgi:hypothetical protein
MFLCYYAESLNLPLNDMFAKRSFSSIVGWFHASMNDKSEPMIKAVANLVNELFTFSLAYLQLKAMGLAIKEGEMHPSHKPSRA